MDATYLQEYEQFELRHWWFIARREIIQQAIKQFAKPTAETRWLDIGCGTGVLLDSFGAITKQIGVELDAGSVERARAKGLDVRQIGTDWDFRELGLFDLITLTDVIEHVEREQPAIAAARAALRENGVLLVTVPALMSLWSSHDVANHHFRRYRRAGLLKLFPESDWQIVKASYFSSLLLPVIWMARKWSNFRTRTRSRPQSQARHDFKFGPLDGMFRAIFRMETPLLRWTNLPLGSSILLVVRKK